MSSIHCSAGVMLGWRWKDGEWSWIGDFPEDLQKTPKFDGEEQIKAWNHKQTMAEWSAKLAAEEAEEAEKKRQEQLNRPKAQQSSIVSKGKGAVDYSKWDNMDFSDSDDD